MADLVVCYELAQADLVAEYLKEHADAQVVTFDFWAEQALKERGIAFRSITYFPGGRTPDIAWLRLAQRFCKEWYRLPELSFFAYKSVRIGESAELILLNHVERILLFTNLLERVVDESCETLVVPHTSATLPRAGGALLKEELSAPFDAAAMFAKSRSLRLVPLGTPLQAADAPEIRERQSWRHSALHILNSIIAYTAPKRRIKLFASEYWNHIEPVMEHATDAEMILMDRNQLSVIPWRAIWTHRIRFIHPQDQVTDDVVRLAEEKKKEFAEKWPTVRPAIERLARELSDGLTTIAWWPIVLDGIETLIEAYAPRIVAEAEGIERILRQEKIDKVLLRASMGGRQHHFFTTSCVANELGIPSIELQHGGGEYDPNGPGARLAASYLAAYGTMTRELYVKNFHLNPERIKVVGSPRFDRYVATSPLSVTQREAQCRMLGLDPTQPIVLGAVPAENTGASLDPQRLDSYDVAEFFEMAAALKAKVPAVQIIFKFRARYITEYHRAYLKTLFPEGGYVITDGEDAKIKTDFFALLQLANAAVSGKSTVIFETMIVDVPLICFQWRTNDIHREIYRELGPMIDSKEECVTRVQGLLSDGSFCNDRLAYQKEFIASNFLFDGNAAERVATLLHEPLRSFAARCE